MRIYTDISVTNMISFTTGIQRVVREILLRFIGMNDVELVMLYYRNSKDSFFRIDNRRFFDYYSTGRGIRESMMTKEKMDLDSLSSDDVFLDIDAAWMGKIKRSYLLPVLKQKGVKIASLIYDTIPISFPEYCEDHVVYRFMDYLSAHMIYDDILVVNAEATKNELKKISKRLEMDLPLCKVVPLGADFSKSKFNISENNISDKVSEAAKSDFLLMVGTIEPRKNCGLLLAAYDSGLKEMGINIVYAGKWGWNVDEFRMKLEGHPDYNKRVFYLERVNDDEISYLYTKARFLVYCSYMEGFGLPLIESIKRGTPVLAADMDVSKEVAGDYADYFEQDNPTELVGIVKKYVEDSDLYRLKREGLKSASFPDWDRCAEMMLRELETFTK